MHRGLAGRVAGADDDHVEAAAARRLGAPGSVVDAAAEKLLHPLDLETAPDHPRGRDQERCLEPIAAVEIDFEATVGAGAAPDDRAPDQELGAEPLRLAAREPRQLGAADALRKAEEVLDQRRVRGLAARNVLLDGDGGEAVRSRVDGGRQPGRPGADDRQVIGGAGGHVLDPPGLRDPVDRRRRDHLVGVDHDRVIAGGDTARAEELGGLGGSRLDPLERLRDPGEEVAQALVLEAERSADDAYIRAHRAHERMSAPYFLPWRPSVVGLEAMARSDSFAGSGVISGAYPPIAEHGLIGDLQTAALVGADGTIDWYCMPRFDSPSVFAAILDHADGGSLRAGRRASGRARASSTSPTPTSSSPGSSLRTGSARSRTSCRSRSIRARSSATG